MYDKTYSLIYNNPSHVKQQFQRKAIRKLAPGVLNE